MINILQTDDESKILSNLQIKVQSLDSLECELSELKVIEQKAFDRLNKLEKAQVIKLKGFMFLITSAVECVNT